MSGIQPGDEVSGDWIRRTDPTSGKKYYANFVTQASSWTQPEDWVEPTAAGGAAPPPTAPASAWKAVDDPASGKCYYFNPQTMETTWTKPADFVEEPEAPAGTKKKARPSILAYMPPSADNDSDEETDAKEEEKDPAPPLERKVSEPPPPPPAADSHGHRKQQASMYTFGSESLGAQLGSMSFESVAEISDTSSWDEGKQKSMQTERKNMVALLKQNEQDYLNILRVLAEEFGAVIKEKEARGEKLLQAVELARLVRNAPALYEQHQAIWKNVFETLKEDEFSGPELCKRLMSHCFAEAAWVGYGFYQASADVAAKAFAIVKNEREGLLDVCSTLEKQAKCTMNEMLEKPCSRLKYYVQVFTKICHTIDPGNKDFMDLYREVIDNFKDAENEGLRSAVMKKARDRVSKIQKQMHFPKKSPNNLNLITPTRYHIIDGQFKKKFGSGGHMKASKQYWFFLFNDLLLYTTLPNKKGQCEPKYALPLMGAYVDTTQPEKMHISIKSPIKDITMKCSTMEERDLWLNHLRNAIAKLSDTSEPNRRQKQKTTTKRGW